MNRTLQPAGPVRSGSPLHHRRPAAASDRLLAFSEAGAATARLAAAARQGVIAC
ncbi:MULTISPECIES: hypothetical protein [unclassified Streptomyces]|uniref:hypothetical protein n=1 Tax=unclassified Streptomyces TaxID=2593676 RepID=UPI0033D707F8